MTKTIKTAVVGVGYFGHFHAQKYAVIANAELIAIVDTDQQRCRTIAETLGTQALSDYHDLLGKVDAVSIVVPTQQHFTTAKFFLENGIHVLLEKPITTTLKDAKELIALAKQHQCILQVGHLERFNSVLVALQDILDAPQFIECNRIAPYNPRGADANVVFDLMIHDIDLIQQLVGSSIKTVDASSACVISKTADIANARLHFENGCVVNVTSSRISLKKERKMRIFQRDTYLSIDFQQKTVAINRKGKEEMYPGIPEIISEKRQFEDNDALLAEIASFIECIIEEKTPLVSGEDGMRALETAIKIAEYC